MEAHKQNFTAPSVISISNMKLWFKRILWCLAFIGMMFVMYVYSTMYSQIRRYPITNDLVYGHWIEQNVALHKQDELRFSEQGVHKNGVLIATHFEFDGNNINIPVANRQLQYRMLKKDGNKIQQQGSPFYQPTFLFTRPN